MGPVPSRAGRTPIPGSYRYPLEEVRNGPHNTRRFFEKAKSIQHRVLNGGDTTEDERLFLMLYQRCHHVEQDGKVRTRLPEV